MILFSRVRGAFRGIDSREWALLALETFGVLAGILIAFQLNEWASRRNEAARHRMMMDRLLEELAYDVTMLRIDRDFIQSRLTEERAFAVALTNGQCPSDELFQAGRTVTVLPAISAPTSVYQELMGAGGLSSIERFDVRDHLAEFHDTLNWSKDQVAYFRESRISPFEEDDPRIRMRFDPTAKNPSVLTFDRPALCRDQVFKNKVASATKHHTSFASLFQGALEDAISICVRLGDSLGRACTPPYGGPLKGEDAAFAAKVTEEMRKDKAKLGIN